MLSGFSDARHGLISLQHISLITLFIPYGIMIYFRGDRREPEALSTAHRGSGCSQQTSRDARRAPGHSPTPRPGQSWDSHLDQAHQVSPRPTQSHAQHQLRRQGQLAVSTRPGHQPLSNKARKLERVAVSAVSAHPACPQRLQRGVALTAQPQQSALRPSQKQAGRLSCPAPQHGLRTLRLPLLGTAIAPRAPVSEPGG